SAPGTACVARELLRPALDGAGMERTGIEVLRKARRGNPGRVGDHVTDRRSAQEACRRERGIGSSGNRVIGKTQATEPVELIESECKTESGSVAQDWLVAKRRGSVPGADLRSSYIKC